ncbi:MAG: hypothetical protein Q7K26_06050 [bacterium]|nr:hypothetical protein [bacterium]
MNKILVFLTVVIPIFCSAGSLPDPNLTPGAINLDVTQQNINETICVPGWTKTIRPPASYTTKLKIKQLRGDGVYHSDLGASYFEEDHLISLELGGHPTDERNLWPQPWDSPDGAHEKDVLENRLKRLVCVGTISLKEAQDAIASDWIAAHQKYILDARKRRVNAD